MSTKIFQMYREECKGNSLRLFQLFFETFSRWDWARPVQLAQERKIRKTPRQDPMVVRLPPLEVRPWVFSTSGLHNPNSLNTCKNVTRATLAILSAELTLARNQIRTLSQPVVTQLQRRTLEGFSRVMERRGFFQCYPGVLELSFCKESPDVDGPLIDHVKWQLKHLLTTLDPFLETGEIYEHYFVHDAEHKARIAMYVGAKFQPVVQPVQPVDNAAMKFPLQSQPGGLILHKRVDSLVIGFGKSFLQSLPELKDVQIRYLPRCDPLIQKWLSKELVGMRSKKL
jgi:hypothetical protein